MPAGTAQSIRASMPREVSPSTPAFMTVALMPLAISITSRRAGQACDEETPLPRVLLPPRATMVVDWACAALDKATPREMPATVAAQVSMLILGVMSPPLAVHYNDPTIASLEWARPRQGRPLATR